MPEILHMLSGQRATAPNWKLCCFLLPEKVCSFEAIFYPDWSSIHIHINLHWQPQRALNCRNSLSLPGDLVGDAQQVLDVCKCRCCVCTCSINEYIAAGFWPYIMNHLKAIPYPVQSGDTKALVPHPSLETTTVSFSSSHSPDLSQPFVHS